MSFNSKIGSGAMVAGLAFLFSIFISFYSYRFLWTHADKDLFAAWIAVFELSQFLLLLDIGFTHSFIKRNISSNWEEIERQLPKLRGLLLGAAVIASVIIIVCAYQLGSVKQSNFLSYVFLALSIGFALLGYADTAALRLRNQFGRIYLINIFSNLVFILFLNFELVSDVIERLSIATFIRSSLQYILQNYILAAGMRVAWPGQLSGSAEVIALNASYFILFMLDAFVMAALGVPLIVVASVIVLKKYYDGLRGLWDSTLGVISIAFAKISDKRRDWIIRLLVVASYICAWFFSELLVQIWLNDKSVDFGLSVGIGVFVMSLTLYRIETTRLYFQGAFGVFIPIVAAVFIKSVFAGLLFLSLLEVSSVYILQGLLIIGAIIGMNWLRPAEEKSEAT